MSWKVGFIVCLCVAASYGMRGGMRERRPKLPNEKMLPLGFDFPGEARQAPPPPRTRRPMPAVTDLRGKSIEQLQKLLKKYTGGSVVGDELMAMSAPIIIPSAARIREFIELASQTDFSTLVESATGRRMERSRNSRRRFQARDARSGYGGQGGRAGNPGRGPKPGRRVSGPGPRDRRQASRGLAANNRPSAETNTANGLGLQSEAVFRELVSALKLTREEIRFAYSLTRGPSGGEQDITVLRVILSLFRGFDCPFSQSMFTCDPTARYRSINGQCNNLKNPSWGMASTAFRRFLFPRYSDVIGKPFTEKTFTGLPQITPRRISRIVHTRTNSFDMDISHMVMQFGQFIDHDITLAPDSRDESGEHPPSCCVEDGDEDGEVPEDPIVRQEIQNELNMREECIRIPIPADDPDFSPRLCMSQVRSQVAPLDTCQVGVREQVNALTSYVDASMVYGSNNETAFRLRERQGGRLASQAQPEGRPLLPLVPEPESCFIDPEKPAESCFEAGDGRVNEHPGLASMHTMLMREHNRIAGELAKINPMWNDETLYQESRKIVGAIVQHILYGDDLKILMGPEEYARYMLAPQPQGKFFTGYDDEVDGSMRNDFATSAYRFGHTLIRDTFTRLTSSGQRIDELRLREQFDNPQTLYSEGGPDSILRGLVKDQSESFDRHVTAEVTSHLFETLAKSPIDATDLISLNINRARDHGLDSYVSYRKAFGLSVPTSFDDLPDHDEDAIKSLKAVYANINDVEVFPGAISETCVTNGILGPLFARMIGRQFQLTKEGDRFWYETNNPTTGFTIEQLDEIRKVSLSRLLCDNVNMRRMQVNAFLLPHPRDNPRVSCSSIPSIDLTKWRDCQEPTWGQWASWSECCRGYRERIRRCVSSEHGCGEEGRCEGYNREFRKCSCTSRSCNSSCRRRWRD